MKYKYNILYVDMVADMFHINHVIFLKECKNLCKYLYVGIHSDEIAENIDTEAILGRASPLKPSVRIELKSSEF